MELALLAIGVLDGISFAILGKLSVEDVDAITGACVLESTPGRESFFLDFRSSCNLYLYLCRM